MKDNKLIAEFMGAKPLVLGGSTEYEMYGVLDCIEDGVDEKHYYIDDEMRFHESWDWLMPVHRKCMFTPNFSGDDQLRTLLIDAVIDADINRLYDAVVEFIKEYNVDNADSEDDACDMLYGVDNNQ